MTNSRANALMSTTRKHVENTESPSDLFRIVGALLSMSIEIPLFEKGPVCLAGLIISIYGEAWEKAGQEPDFEETKQEILTHIDKHIK